MISGALPTRFFKRATAAIVVFSTASLVFAQQQLVNLDGLVGYYDFEESGVAGLANKAPGATEHDGAYLGDISLIAGTGAGFAGDAAYVGADPIGSSDRSTLLVGNALNIAKDDSGTTAGKGHFRVASLSSRGGGADDGGSLGTDFSVSSWFHLAPDPDNVSTTGNIIRNFVFEAVANYDISWGTGTDGVTYTPYLGETAGSASLLDPNAWHHVLHTVSSSGGTSTLNSYVNGNLSATITVPTSAVDFQGINFGANRTNERIFDGMLDELSAWGRALDASDAFSMYNLGRLGQPLDATITMHVKADNTTALDQGASWDSGSMPAATDLVVFDSTFTQSGALDAGAALAVAGLRVSDGTGLIDIDNGGGTSPLQLGALGIDMMSAGRDLRIADVEFAVDQNWGVGMGRALTIVDSSGSQALAKVGTGELVFMGDIAHTGGTTVSGGALVIDKLAVLDNAAAGISVASGAALSLRFGDYLDGYFDLFEFSDLMNNTLGGVDMADGAYAGIDTSHQDTLVSDAISGTRGVAKTGSGTLTFAADNEYTGGTRVMRGTLQIGDGGTSGSVQGNIINDAILSFNRSDDVTYSGVVSGEGQFIKEGSGKLVLPAVQTFSGATTVNAGILELSGGSPGSGGHRLNSSLLRVNDGGTFSFTGTAQFGWAAGTPDVVVDGGRIISSNGIYNYLKDVTLANGGRIEFGNVTTGYTAVQAYSTSSLKSLASADANVVTGGAIAVASGGGLTVDVERGAADVDLLIETVLRNHPISNAAGVLVKTGDGILELAGVNTYTGSTTVQAGTLMLSGALASAVTAEAGAVVAGSGSFNGGLTMNAGSSLAPGDSPGAMNTSGDLNLSDAPAITVDLNNFDPELGSQFTIIDGYGWLTGEFDPQVALRNASAGWGAGGKGFRIDEGSVVLTVIPEPGTIGMMLMVAFAALLRRRC